MKKAFIVNYHYFDETGNQITVGGVQTYITNLAVVLKEMGFVCIVFQCAVCNFEKSYNGVDIFGFKISGNNKQRAKKMRKHLENCVNPKTDLVIFASELLSSKMPGVKTITIEHGIGWDIPEQHRGWFNSIKAFLIKSYHSYERVLFSTNSNLLVCVDYNFINWYRASAVNQNINYVVIPNFTELAPYFEKPKDGINIIFARRLIDYRGTRQICKVINCILEEFAYMNIFFTIAGTGPDLEWMKNELKNYHNNVEFISYSSDESLRIHSNKHIAVVPTLGSEGTSLSLLEAMSSQCAVVCTDVGGMTNVVINGYNGLMINAGNTQKLYEAIKVLILDSDLRNTIAAKGYETIKTSFAFTTWSERWKKVVTNLMDY